MKAGQYIRLLAEFVSGDIDLTKFERLIEDRLFELRQKPEMTEEKSVLSSIELYLHETKEGQRIESEVYAHVQSILDKVILRSSKSEGITKRSEPVLPKIPYLLSKHFDIDLTSSKQELAEIKELRPVTSK